MKETQPLPVSLDWYLARYAAPTLLGVKSASLFAWPLPMDERLQKEIDSFNHRADPRDLAIRPLCGCGSRTLLLTFRRTLLKKELTAANRKKMLCSFGYDTESSLDSLLDTLSLRIAERREFPHEIGLFLGYPVEDVQGFILYRGKGCKCRGYWHVYSDEQRAKKLFHCYSQCRQYLCRRLEQNGNLMEILKIA